TRQRKRTVADPGRTACDLDGLVSRRSIDLLHQGGPTEGIHHPGPPRRGWDTENCGLRQRTGSTAASVRLLRGEWTLLLSARRAKGGRMGGGGGAKVITTVGSQKSRVMSCESRGQDPSTQTLDFRLSSLDSRLPTP